MNTVSTSTKRQKNKRKFQAEVRAKEYKNCTKNTLEGSTADQMKEEKIGDL